MVLHAPSLPSNWGWLRGFRPRAILAERWNAVARRSDSPVRYAIGFAFCGGLALLVTLGVLAASLEWSLAYGVLLIPCALGWLGFLNEFGVVSLWKVKPAETVQQAAPAEEPPAKPAAKPATPRRRKTATATATPKPRSNPA